MALNQKPSCYQFAYSCEGERTTLTAALLFDANGQLVISGSGLQVWQPNGKPTPTNSAPGTYAPAQTKGFGYSQPGTRGIATVVQPVAYISTAAGGDLLITLQGNYTRFLEARVTQINTGGLNAGPGGPGTTASPGKLILVPQVVLTTPSTQVSPGVPNPIEVLLMKTGTTVATYADLANQQINLTLVLDASST